MRNRSVCPKELFHEYLFLYSKMVCWYKMEQTENRIVKDSNAVVTNLKSGTLDMYARLSSTQTAQLAEDSDFTIYDGGMNLVQALYLNNTVEPLNNVKVRQALCYAANRQEVLDMIADGKGTIIGSSMFPAFGKYYVPELSERYNQDIQKAKELLKEAGYPDGFELTITVPNNYQQHIDTAQVLVEQLKAIGVTAKIQQVEWDSWLSDVYADRKFQSTVVGVDAAYPRTLSATATKSMINCISRLRPARMKRSRLSFTKKWKHCSVTMRQTCISRIWHARLHFGAILRAIGSIRCMCRIWLKFIK